MAGTAKPANDIGAPLHAAGIEIAAAQGAISRRVQLLPMGSIQLIDGRGPFELRDRAHAEAVVAATRERLGRRDLMIDYDHQVKFGAQPGVGGTARAAGWVKPDALSADDDGIWAEVDWTEAATAAIAAREYRYISPLFMVDAARRVAFLINAALVNIPAIDMAAVAAASTDGEDMPKIAEALGLAADANEDAVLGAIAALKTTAAAIATIAAAAGLAADAEPQAIAAAFTDAKKAGEPDPAKFVPIAALAEVQGQVAALLAKDAEAEVAAAMQAGKITPALKGWATDFAVKDREGFRKYLEAAPVVVAAGSVLADKKTEPATTLTPDEIAACEMTGMSQADFLKVKNEGIV